MKRAAAGLATAALIGSGLAAGAWAPAGATPPTTVSVTGTVADLPTGYAGEVADLELDGWDGTTWQWVASAVAVASDWTSGGSAQLTIPSDADYTKYALTATSDLPGYDSVGGVDAEQPADDSAPGAFSVVAGQDNPAGAVELAPQAGTRWVSGTVDGPHGALADGSVQFEGWSGQGTPQWTADDDPDWSGTRIWASTDENGRFLTSVAAGTYHLAYSADNCVVPLDAPDLLVTDDGGSIGQPIALSAVTLQNAGTCTELGGRLTVNGHGTENASATLYRWSGSSDEPGWQPIDQTEVAGDGTYSFQTALPQDDATDYYTVAFDLPFSDSEIWLGGSGEPAASDVEGATVPVTATAPTTVQVPDAAVTVAPVTLSGRVYDEGDTGFTADGTVSLFKWTGSTFAQVADAQPVTEDRSDFSFPDQDPTATYYVAFHSAVPGADDEYVDEATATPTSPDSDGTFGGFAGTDLWLGARAPRRLVSGTVTDADGHPLAGIPVSASNPATYGDSDLTDEAGHWQMSLPVGSEKIVYAADDVTCFEPATAYQEVAISTPRADTIEAPTQKLTAETTCTTLAGTVTKQGAAEADQEVDLYHVVTRDDGDGDGDVWSGADEWSYATTDENGAYSFHYARPGQSYILQAQGNENVGDDDYYVRWLANIGAEAGLSDVYQEPGFILPASAGATYQVPDLALQPTTTVRGTAALAGGAAPDYGIEVLKWNAQDEAFDYFYGVSQRVDEDGGFRLVGLPAGAYTLEFYPEDGGDFGDTYYGGGTTEPTGPNATAHVFTVASGDLDTVKNVGSTTLAPFTGELPPPVHTPKGNLAGSVTTADANPVVGAYVTACAADGSGACGYGQTASDGTYEIDGLPVGDYTLDVSSPDPTLFGASGTATVDLGETTQVDVLKLREPVKAPTSAAVSLVNAPATSAGATPTLQPTTFNGVPSFYYDDPVNFSISGCPGTYGDLDGDGHADTAPAYEITRTNGSVITNGSLTAGDVTDGAAAFTARLAKLYPNHGGATISTNILATCDQGAAPVTFDVFIDPSGVVTDQYGRTLSGASVTLLKGPSADGPFEKVTDGDPAVMSPANTANPTVTDSTGFFRWDVAPGFYEITAEKSGCDPSTTDPMSVPPLQIDLVIPLDCNDAVAPVASGVPTVGGSGTVGSMLTVSDAGVTWPAPLESAGVELYRDYGTSDAHLVDDCEGQDPCVYEVTSADAGHPLTAVAVGQRPDYTSPTGLSATFAAVEQAGRTVYGVAPATTDGDTTPPVTGGTTPPTTGGGDTTPPTTGGGDTTPPTTGGGDTTPPTTGGGDTTPPTHPAPQPTVTSTTGIAGHVVAGSRVRATLPTYKHLPVGARTTVVWFVNGKRVGTGRQLVVKKAWAGKRLVAKVTATWTVKVDGHKVSRHLTRASKPVRVGRG